MPVRAKRRGVFEAIFIRALLVAIFLIVMISLLTEFVKGNLVLATVLSLIVFLAVIAFFFFRRRSRITQARGRLEQAQQLGHILTVSGAEFEEIAAALFRSIGYSNVTRVGGSGDLGVDLLATSPEGLSTVIQCKRYGRGQKIGSPAVQSLMGAVVNSGASQGVFVTTSAFTGPAIQCAKSGRVPIRLIDGDELTQLAKFANRSLMR